MAREMHAERDRITLFNKKIFRIFVFPFPERSSRLHRPIIERGV
jgi:hypothetical protein